MDPDIRPKPSILVAILVATLGAVAGMSTNASAAESDDNCTGFIDSVPATIATQGTWCLRHDLSTAMASGNAITIKTNTVTIDCNDFESGGPAAGEASSARWSGFVDALPAVIATQGTWCLRADVSTAIANGVAIAIQANNVTLDCNHFKVGVLPGGASSSAYGVYASNRANVTARNCAIRGPRVAEGRRSQPSPVDFPYPRG